MKTKFLLMLTVFTVCHAQESNINQYNTNGEKEGYWIEGDVTGMFKLYYKNGKRHGLMKMKSIHGDLWVLGFYEEGLETGVFYYFHEGKLISLLKDFQHNINPIKTDEGPIYRNQCYDIGFHPNGIIAHEGSIIWNEDPESDDAHRYGEWKFYNENGILIKTEHYK